MFEIRVENPVWQMPDRVFWVFSGKRSHLKKRIDLDVCVKVYSRGVRR